MNYMHYVNTLSFREAVELSHEVGIASERTESDKVILVLKDKSELHFISEYDAGYSEYTPGSGIEPPSAKLFKPGKHP